MINRTHVIDPAVAEPGKYAGLYRVGIYGSAYLTADELESFQSNSQFTVALPPRSMDNTLIDLKDLDIKLSEIVEVLHALYQPGNPSDLLCAVSEAWAVIHRLAAVINEPA